MAILNACTRHYESAIQNRTRNRFRPEIHWEIQRRWLADGVHFGFVQHRRGEAKKKRRRTRRKRSKNKKTCSSSRPGSPPSSLVIPSVLPRDFGSLPYRVWVGCGGFYFHAYRLAFQVVASRGQRQGSCAVFQWWSQKKNKQKQRAYLPSYRTLAITKKKGGGGWVGLDGAMGKRLTWLASLIGFIGTYPRVSCRFRRRFRWGFPRLFVEFQFVWAPGRRRIDRPLTSSSTGPTEKKKLAATNGSGNRKDRLQSVGLLRFHSTLEGTLSLSFGIDVEENSTPSQRCSPRARRKSLFALEKEPKQVAVRHDQFFAQWKANFNRDASFFFIGKEAVIWLSIVARRDRWWQRRVPVRFPANAFSKQFPYNGDANLSLAVKYFPIFI